MEEIIILKDTYSAQVLFGPQDTNIANLEKEFKVKIILRGDSLKIVGVKKNVLSAADRLEDLLSSHTPIVPPLRREAGLKISSEKPNNDSDEEELDIGFSFKGKSVSPKTEGQRVYIQAIKDADIVFGIGPAGTGKTYLAMAMAIEALRKGYVRRIILTRPAIEAGESLGYLPGTLYEKILPYLRPLYDALYEMMEAQHIEKYIEVGTIEVAPLAYMRGRTLNDAFVILDEAQNCTSEQLKMFLTRLGFDSKTVITGDTTQSDLPEGKPSGLLQAVDVLKNIPGIKFAYLTGKDVVRHELVQAIIAAYEKANHPVK